MRMHAMSFDEAREAEDALTWLRGIGSGAASGAATGAVAGPWGAVIGGAVGAGLGALQTHQQQQQQRQQPARPPSRPQPTRAPTGPTPPRAAPTPRPPTPTPTPTGTTRPAPSPSPSPGGGSDAAQLTAALRQLLPVLAHIATNARGSGTAAPEPTAPIEPAIASEPPPSEAIDDRLLRRFHAHDHGDPAAQGSHDPSHPLNALHRAIAGLATETAFETAAESVQWFEDGWQGPFAGEGARTR